VGRFPGQFLRRTKLIKRSLRPDEEPTWRCLEPLHGAQPPQVLQTIANYCKLLHLYVAPATLPGLRTPRYHAGISRRYARMRVQASGRPGWVSAASSCITVSRGRRKRATGDGVLAGHRSVGDRMQASSARTEGQNHLLSGQTGSARPSHGPWLFF